MATQDPVDWVTRAADDAVRHHERTGADGPVTCSSGISPSGPVHLGNLREFLMPHFVADELRRRGVPVRHLHVWDDYDRFRKVPYGVDPSFAEHIGRPLVAVPDPWGCHDSWSTHYKEPVLATFAALGAEVETISQAERYRSGVYRDEVLRAVRHRAEIDAVLEKHRTKKVRGRRGPRTTSTPPRRRRRWPTRSRTTRTTARAASATSRSSPTAATAAATRRRSRRTTTTPPTSPTPARCATTTARPTWRRRTRASWSGRPTGRCAGPSSTSTSSRPAWTMRRRARRSPSATSWSSRCGTTRARHGSATASSGFAGVQKMSSSAGGAPTAEDALRVLEPGILRWLYVRRQPKQTFDIDFGQEVVRLYDEWDALAPQGRRPRQARHPGARLRARLGDRRPTARCRRPRVVVPFRMLASVADVTAGSAEQISRIVAHLGHAHDSVDDLEPRLSRAMAWTAEFVPAADRTTVRVGARRGRDRGAVDRRSGSGSRCCSRGCRATSSSTR